MSAINANHLQEIILVYPLDYQQIDRKREPNKSRQKESDENYK